jgi:OmpA family/Sad1 / UNC-like C-terminal
MKKTINLNSFGEGKMRVKTCLSFILFILAACVVNAAEIQDLLDLASGAVLISYTSEYSDGWGSLLLLDGTSSRGWCSSAPNPNTFVIELAAPSTINKLVFDTTDSQEPSYPGISAREIEVYGSTKSAEEGFTKIGAFEAAKGGRKEFPLTPPATAQWLKFVVLSNWGQKEYTELMELEAYGTMEQSANVSFSGIYKTNYGPIELKQDGNQISGCYYDGKGSFRGVLEGRAARMEWRQDEGRKFGGLMMVLTADRKFLNGLWYENGAIGGKWFGNRLTDMKSYCPAGTTNGIAQALHESGRTIAYGIQFDSDSAHLKSESDATLKELKETMQQEVTLKVSIEGHTDSTNTDQYNLQLSEKRAAAVVSWLVGNGIDSTRLSAKGFGESQPVADNATPQGRALNRRVEITAQK